MAKKQKNTVIVNDVLATATVDGTVFPLEKNPPQIKHKHHFVIVCSIFATIVALVWCLIFILLITVAHVNKDFKVDINRNVAYCGESSKIEGTIEHYGSREVRLSSKSVEQGFVLDNVSKNHFEITLNDQEEEKYCLLYFWDGRHNSQKINIKCIKANDAGTNWIGYKQGVLECLDDKDNIYCIGSASNYFADNLIIPSFVYENNQKNEIEKINEKAFSNANQGLVNQNITGTICFPNTLKTIGYYAFFQCCYLTGDLNIPNNVTSISNWAFWGCDFNSVLFPSTLATVGQQVIGSIVQAQPCNLSNVTLEGWTDIPQLDDNVSAVTWKQNSFVNCTANKITLIDCDFTLEAAKQFLVSAGLTLAS